MPITDIDVTKLTEGDIKGEGVFDILMSTTKLHLDEEYKAGRIVGKEYATVYIGALNAVLAQSVQYIINSAQIDKISAETDLADSQILKTAAEIALLEQKTITELAQTSDTLDISIGLNAEVTVQGTVEKQKNLFAKQTDGFDRDAEQKLAKIMVDSWAVRQTTDGAVVDTNGLADGQIDKVLDVAKIGIGVDPDA